MVSDISLAERMRAPSSLLADALADELMIAHIGIDSLKRQTHVRGIGLNGR